MDLIFVSMEDWDDIWRRNQFLCAALVRRFPETRILFVGMHRDVSNLLRRGKLGELRGKGTRTIPDLPNITVMKPLKFTPNSLALSRRFNERLIRLQVRQAARRLGFRSPLLWLNPHYAVHMVGRMEERAVIYDITDDWITLTQAESLTRLIIAEDAELCRRADAVIVCSQRLFDLKRDLARNLHLIPNGVDSAHYRCVREGTGPLPEETATWPRPVFGYTGSIHPDRVDLDLVETLARRLPCGSIALVGPDMLQPNDQARMRALPNVFFTGAVPYRRLPEIMRAFDVCITPHKMTPFTESLNPIKLWEYLAAGKPIVATDIAGFRDYPQFVRIASDADSFLRAMQEALQEDPTYGAARQVEVAPHSWEARLDAVLDVIRGVTTLD